MAPKEKAENLKETFRLNVLDYERCSINSHKAIQCALIAADEIINTLSMDIRDVDVRGNILLDLIDYWKQVKQEIEKI